MKFSNGLTGTLLLGALALAACAPQAAATPDAMMGQATMPAESGMMEATPEGDSMMMHETPTADSMMMNATPSSDSMAAPEPSMSMAEWLGTPLNDARTGQGFKVSDYDGKVVLVETMAVWCTTCRLQQEQIRALDSQMMDQTSDLKIVSLDIDPNEDAAILKKYVDNTGFGWHFAIAPAELVRTIGRSYGDQFLNPPSAPVLVLDRHGVAHPLPFGVKSADDLKQAVEPFLQESS
jgi:cytochrome oxidase Cu insertion factor (SCO1/SenC/PrrC family)